MSHSSSTEHRDYRLTGPEAARAAEKGLVSASWYQCPISRKRLKELMQRRDGPALRDTALWILALLATGFGGYWFWGSWALCHFLLPTGCCMAPPPMRAGMKWATARRSKPAG